MDSTGKMIKTIVSATVAADREDDLIHGYRDLISAGMPEGLRRSQLLRGQGGTWRIESLWSDMDALHALREGGQKPLAIDLFERVGAEHRHEWYIVEEDHEA
jgi:hypothetical protein